MLLSLNETADYPITNGIHLLRQPLQLIGLMSEAAKEATNVFDRTHSAQSGL